MANTDTNAIIRAYLATDAALIAVVGQHIYVPRLPQGAALPAVSFFVRGGPPSNPYIPGIVTHSVQVDCWAEDIDGGTPGVIGAREVYSLVFDSLQGIQQQTVTVGVADYRIMSAIEEVPGQDLVDEQIPEYFKVMTFFSIMMDAEI